MRRVEGTPWSAQMVKYTTSKKGLALSDGLGKCKNYCARAFHDGAVNLAFLAPATVCAETSFQQFTNPKSPFFCMHTGTGLFPGSRQLDKALLKSA